MRGVGALARVRRGKGYHRHQENMGIRTSVPKEMHHGMGGTRWEAGRQKKACTGTVGRRPEQIEIWGLVTQPCVQILTDMIIGYAASFFCGTTMRGRLGLDRNWR